MTRQCTSAIQLRQLAIDIQPHRTRKGRHPTRVPPLCLLPVPLRKATRTCTSNPSNRGRLRKVVDSSTHKDKQLTHASWCTRGALTVATQCPRPTPFSVEHPCQIRIQHKGTTSHPHVREEGLELTPRKLLVANAQVAVRLQEAARAQEMSALMKWLKDTGCWQGNAAWTEARPVCAASAKAELLAGVRADSRQVT